MSMNNFCCKQIFENEDEVSKGYSKEHLRRHELQTTKTLSQSNPQSEENNQDLKQSQINNLDKADLNIQEKEKVINQSIFQVQFNNQQKINTQDKSQHQNPYPLKIINQTNDNHKLQTTTQQKLDQNLNSISSSDFNSFDIQSADYLNKCEIQKLSTPQLIQQKNEFPEYSDFCLKQESLINYHYQDFQLCKYCDQWVSQNYIQLECQHNYCIECFKLELKQQCQTSDCIKFYCRCTIKISEKTILLLRKHQLIPNILDRLRKNQIGKLVSQVRQLYKAWTCPNKYCSFICIIQDNLNINLFYCPNCLSFTGQ